MIPLRFASTTQTIRKIIRLKSVFDYADEKMLGGQLERNTVSIAFILASALAVSSCQPAQENKSKVRFTVANRNAKNVAFVVGSPNNLPGVTRDVNNVSKMIQESNLGYELVTMNYATSSQILSKAKEIGSKISPDSTVLFYFSGHGAQTGQLVGQSDSLFTMKDVAYSIKEGAGNQSFKRFITVIDACHSGQSVDGSEAMFLAGTKRPFSVDQFIEGITQGSSSGSGLFGGSAAAASDGPRPFEQGLVIAAAKSSEYSGDFGPTVGGIFTASLMNAIRSNTSATLSEILENAKRLTMNNTGDQTPVWKATPSSILNERFNDGGTTPDSSNVTPPNNNVPPGGDQPAPTPAPTPNGNVTPEPQPAPEPNKNNNNDQDFLQKLLAILNGVMSDEE